jgi:reactive intermediate/imine deaminase
MNQPLQFLDSGRVLSPGMPFSEAVRVGDTLYLSGQMGIEPGTMRLVPGGIREQARQTMENIKTTLEAHGATLADVVKCTLMLADINDWHTVNDVYMPYFEAGRLPARSAFAAQALALGGRVEIECIAVLGTRPA